ncbi:MAG: hypothetical protein GIX02_14340 [Candidatus Eremiobacteraeota bacterium]|nr:hypothetical protein [Candidatus Eremiobacteraeota bacterium]
MKRQRGVALIVALGIAMVFLAIAVVILDLASGNSKNVGNAYQKQQYYNVAEAGIDRGLADMDSILPSPGTSAFLSATPAPPPSPPSADQTALPNMPNVAYHYSYWYNASGSPTSTPEPLPAKFVGATPPAVMVPANGAVIWSYTTVGLRDVGVEAIVSRASSSGANCALCAGNNVTVSGATNRASALSQCHDPSGNVVKVCWDPTPPSPAPTPTSVPIAAGGIYQVSGACTAPCAYGDASHTPNPIQTGVLTSQQSGFLASQGSLDQLADAAMWQSLAATSANVHYQNCSSTCSSIISPPSAGQITFLNGNLSMSRGSTSYSGVVIVNGCVSVSGQATYSGIGTSAETIALGTDAACGGYAISVQGNLAWNGGTADAANGSVSISGSGNQPSLFYGGVIAAYNIDIAGNGIYAIETNLKSQVFNFGNFAIDSFAQY